MKKIITLSLLSMAGFFVTAQTSKELVGKWQLVKLIKNGSEREIKDVFKSDQVFQNFEEGGKFQGIVGDKSAKGKWKLSKNNDQLTITVNLIPAKFTVDYFEAEKRIITNDQIGTLEYKKINN